MYSDIVLISISFIIFGIIQLNWCGNKKGLINNITLNNIYTHQQMY